MQMEDLERNDVLAINGRRYEVLHHQAHGYSEKEHLVELNRIGEPAGQPRFMLVFQEQDGVQFWERDLHTGELIDQPVRQVEVLGV